MVTNFEVSGGMSLQHMNASDSDIVPLHMNKRQKCLLLRKYLEITRILRPITLVSSRQLKEKKRGRILVDMAYLSFSPSLGALVGLTCLDVLDT